MEALEITLRNLGLAVSNLPEKGRCLLAGKVFYPGEVIIRQEPYVCVPKNSAAESRCDGCFNTGNLKKCSGCQVVWYCGSTCQKSQWQLHRLECNVLSRLEMGRRKSVTPTIRLMLKLYLRRKLQRDKVIPTTSTDNYNLVEALVAHMEDSDEKQLLLYAQMANLVNLILQLPESETSIKEIAQNFSRLACNAHTICDGELRPTGTGLYPVISIINHSCLPNAVLVFEGNSAVVRAVQRVPRGDEVLISYIETAGSTVTRQKALKEQYFFTCTCLRCIKLGQPDDIRESAVLEGYRCSDEKCNGFLLRDSANRGFVCQSCSRLRTKQDVKKLAAEVKELSKQSISSNNSKEAISILEDIEKMQRKLFHPFSVILVQTRENLIKRLMDEEDWQGALEYCKLTIPVYERVYPEVHPLLGLQYYTCGKLEWLLGDTENAIKSLTNAARILGITHGTSTPFIKELLLKLEEAHAEAAYKLHSRDE
ncbi:Histone-lysine N-methyltransferase ASHR1 [Linum perenne]